MESFIYILLLIISVVYLIIKSKKAMHMLQQNLYNENNRYIKWMGKNLKFVFPITDTIIFILMIVFIFVNCNIKSIILVIESLLMIVSCYLIKKFEKTEQVKKTLVITARVKRLIVTTVIVYLIPLVVYLVDNCLKDVLVFVYMTMVYLNYIMLLIVKIINTPVEKCVYYKFYFQATNKLKKSRVKVIGVTGSYGKTSSKNILADVLSTKYITRPTPKNLNTEYGLMITINNHLTNFDEVFIAEMGAYKRGEIKTLCNMVHPKYGILTKIGTAHLESFGSQENITKTKFELIESLPEDGIAVLNRDDELQVSYEIKSKCKKLWIGIDNTDNCDAVASNIKCDYNGSTFDVKFKNDDNLYKFQTKLLGKNNVYNILASIALGRELGMSIDELITGVTKVRPIEHRLELKQLGSMYMMDDAYNSNPVGAKAALEVLSMMPGDKVVVTPGMIELGARQDELNREFGRQIATISKADYVILVGEKITKPIYDGLIDENYDKEKIVIINDVTKAYSIVNNLKKDNDIYALFENDLPDSYNE